MTISIKWGAPGCGKTHTLISDFLKHDKQSKLLTTFSRSTANSIKNEVANKIGVDPEKLKRDINTIHGTCYQLLGGPAYGKVVTDKEITDFNQLTGYDFKMSGDTLDPDNGSGVLDCYTWLQNTETPIELVDDYPNFRKLSLAASEVRNQIKHYGEWKKNGGLIDFTDMLSITLKSGLCPGVDLLMVDEFQDLTTLQNKIFNMWALDIENVIVSGDPLQSIYGFMGGSPDHFKNLSGNVTTLPYSYRLSKEVWDYAVNVAQDVEMETPDIETSTHTGHIKHTSYREYINNAGVWGGDRDHTEYHLVRSRYQAAAICQAMAENGIIWGGLGGWTEYQLNVLNAILRVRTQKPLYKPHLLALVNIYPQTLFNFIGHNKELID